MVGQVDVIGSYGNGRSCFIHNVHSCIIDQLSSSTRHLEAIFTACVLRSGDDEQTTGARGLRVSARVPRSPLMSWLDSSVGKEICDTRSVASKRNEGVCVVPPIDVAAAFFFSC